MAIHRQIFAVALATAIFANITAFAQEAKVVKTPQHDIPELFHTRYANGADISRIDYGKIDSELLKQLAELGGTPYEFASQNHGDIRDWLLVKAREYKEGQVNGLSGGFAVTPLGNISQQCYDDVMRFFGDYDTLTPYAMKMWASWGEYTAWFKALFTGNAKSPGQYELCDGLSKEDDGLPFEVQFCFLYYPAVPTFMVNAAIGTCMPASCSAAELMTAHEAYFESTPGFDLRPRQSGIIYDCFEDHPWSGGAIATMCILSFFALLVLIGSVYHVIIHDYVTAVLESLKRADFESKAPENIYEQVVKEDDQKEESTQTTVLTDAKSSEKCVGAGESDIRYPAEDPPVYEEPIHNENTAKPSSEVNSKLNGMTKLMIEDDGQKPNASSIGKLALMDRLLMSFSVFYNTEKIFSTPSSSSPLSCLNGIRVLSMWWVILGHSIAFPLGYRFENPAYALQVSQTIPFLPIMNGTLSVDSFFVLSGFLVTYLTLKEMAKTNGRINWFLFYFHRLWRITPLYMVCIGIWAGMSYHMGKGGGKDPFYEGARELCQDYWWSNLLYINNLYPFPGNLDTQSCMGWSWYLANDMQFFAISPIIIYCLYRFWKWGVSLLVVLCAISFGSTAYVNWYWGLPLGGSGLYNNRTETTEGITSTDDFVYTKPWSRIQSYLVGMALGYLIYKLKGKPLKLNKLVLLIGWLVSTALTCAVLYGTEATNNGPRTAQWLAVSYNAVFRFTFSLSVAWVMFVCITGNGGYINSFLGWNVWAPLAKLSFAAYMVHPIVIYLVILTSKSTLHFTYVEISYWFIANTVASYACAYILSLLIEGPTVGIEKALIGQPSRTRANKEK